MCYWKKTLLCVAMATAMTLPSLWGSGVSAQGYTSKPGIDFFAGVNLNFRDVYYQRQ